MISDDFFNCQSLHGMLWCTLLSSSGWKSATSQEPLHPLMSTEYSLSQLNLRYTIFLQSIPGWQSFKV